jgi:hypothetical protein
MIGATIPLFFLIILHGGLSSQLENGKIIRNSPTSPGPFISSQRSLAAIKVDSNGEVYTTQILKQQLANELGLPLRDLRIVDPSYPTQIQATFTARKKAILFCIENIKVVVQHDEALVFGPLQPEVALPRSRNSSGKILHETMLTTRNFIVALPNLYNFILIANIPLLLHLDCSNICLMICSYIISD